MLFNGKPQSEEKAVTNLELGVDLKLGPDYDDDDLEMEDVDAAEKLLLGDLDGADGGGREGVDDAIDG